MRDNRREPHWGLICGAWGDMICALPYLQQTNIRKVFYFGPSQGVREFLEAQDFIDKAVTLNPYDLGMTKADFRTITAICWDRLENSVTLIKELMTLFKTGVPQEEVLNCVTNSDSNVFPLISPEGIRNTQEAELWAENYLHEQKIEKPFIVLCPISLQSSYAVSHWPHWENYLSWLVSHENVQFVLCGSDPLPYEDILKKPNVLNALYQTPTAAHMYALSSRAEFTICTINGLSHWCNATNLPSLIMENHMSGHNCSYWPRIQQADNLYGIKYQDTLETAKLTTARLVNLQEGGKRRAAPPRDWWREWACQDIRRAYHTCPRISRFDHLSDFGLSEEMYPIYQKIGPALGTRRMLEIGTRVGHSLIALSADNPELEKIDWIDNESYIPGSNAYARENLEHFFRRYRPHRTFPELRYWTNFADVPEEEPGYWDTIYVDGEHAYDAKIRDMNWAIKKSPRCILVDDYYFLEYNRRAIRDFAKDINLPFWEIHTLRGLALFDLTPDGSIGKRLQETGISMQKIELETPKKRPYAAVACIWNHIELLPYFLKHYANLGYQKFFFSIYGGRQSPLWARCEEICQNFDVTLMEEFIPNPTGRTDSAAMIRIAQQYIPPGEWWSPLDLDEFLEFSSPIDQILQSAGTSNVVVGGMLDRLAPDGELRAINENRPLSEQYPLGCYLTRDVLHSTHRKVLLARDISQLGGGHHASRQEKIHPSASGWACASGRRADRRCE